MHWVRVTIRPHGTEYEAVGTGHRLPVVRRIPAATATELISSGVPVVLRRPGVDLGRDSAVASAPTSAFAGGG